ncbi:MAG: DUF1501 domain-containing protein [Pseudomonadota bacterium]
MTETAKMRRDAPTRRHFLSTGAAAAAVAGVCAPQVAFGRAGGKTIIKVFMRGGADGLLLFPKIDDDNYYANHQGAAVPRPGSGPASEQALIFPGRRRRSRALNPNLAPLMEIWEDDNLMVSPATGFPENRRSHFEAQSQISSATAGPEEQGYLNRFLALRGFSDPFAGAVLGKRDMSKDLAGPRMVPVVASPNQFGGAAYSNTALGRGLRLAAELLNAGEPLNAAAVDWQGDWDSHTELVARTDRPWTDQNFRRNRDMATGAGDLLTFYRELRRMGRLRDVVVLVGTEFGRTIQINGSRGTDHGRGGAWFAFGGRIRNTFLGDAPLPDWIPPAQQRGDNPARWLPDVVNYKDIAAEILVRHLGLGARDVGRVLPGWTWTPQNFLRG